MKNRYKFILVGLICLVAGGSIGYFLGYSYEKGILFEKLSELRPIRENDPSYKFIDPLLAYIIPSAEHETELVDLKNGISKIIESNKSKGLYKASIFMSDLNRGRWIGVNENEEYPPASMFKVIIMTAYFKGAEEVPQLFKEKVIYPKEIDDKVKIAAFNSSTDLKIGSSYEIEYLINKMIIDSDNGAEVLLLSHMNKDFFDSLFNTLNISGKKEDGSFLVSPRAYSLFFRTLYSATYLNKNLSEKALDILSKTTFKDGLVAGVPEGTLVSHKFGEYVHLNNSNKIEYTDLHDCGIIYYSENPYLLCVMTRGSNLDVLKNTIKEISSMVFDNRSN